MLSAGEHVSDDICTVGKLVSCLAITMKFASIKMIKTASYRTHTKRFSIVTLLNVNSMIASTDLQKIYALYLKSYFTVRIGGSKEFI